MVYEMNLNEKRWAKYYAAVLLTVVLALAMGCASPAPLPTATPVPADAPVPFLARQLDIKIDPKEAATVLLNPSPLGKGGYSKGMVVTIDILLKEGWQVDEWVGPVFNIDGNTAQIQMDSSQSVAVRLKSTTPEPTPEPTREPTRTPTPTPNLPFCFAAGTPVLTANGLIAIEELQKGDIVLSYDHNFQTRVEANISSLVEANIAAVVSRKVNGLMRVELADGTTIQVTREHPFYAPDESRYKPIGEFKPGERLASIGQDEKLEAIVVTGIKAVRGEFTVYNLSVESSHHNYVAAGVLVHNKTQEPTRKPTPEPTPEPTREPTPPPTSTPPGIIPSGETAWEWDLGAITFQEAPKTWSLELSEDFGRVLVGAYGEGSSTTNKYAGWNGSLVVNGTPVWEFRRWNSAEGGIIYDFLQGKEVLESSSRGELLDCTELFRPGANTITYDHFTDGAHGVKVRVER